jgi:hypothetical protein
MSTTFVFNGQTITIPGSYSTIKSGMKNPPIALPYGNVLVIDTGSGAGYGGGAGIAGEFATGKDSIYEFDNIFDFRDFAKGGLWWLLAQPLFRPTGLGVNGISKISYIKAAQTVAASIIFDFDNTDSNSVSSSSNLTIKVTDEGVIGNGVLVDGNLTKGYAAKLSAGILDTAAFVLTFYRGTYKGLDENNLPFDGISEANSTPIVVAKSPEFTNIQELIDWMAIDFSFNKNFKLESSSITGSGILAPEDLAYYSDFSNGLATGGTESYVSAQYLTDVLSAIADLDINFILADQYGVNAQSNANYAILAHIKEVSKFKPELYVAGGDTVDTFESISLAAARYYNDDSVTVVHGGVKKQSKQGLRKYNALYHATAVMAREAGLEPQVPITFKSLDFDGVQHSLNDKEVTKGLKAGVVMTRKENSTFDIVKGVNSLQQNSFLVNDDGTTHSKQIKRITRQLNKEIIVRSKEDLLKNPNGTNRNTLSDTDLNAWTIGYLKSKQCTPDTDNLILNFQDIVITRQGDGWFISYKFTPNSEISFLFYTGLIIGV